MNGEETAGAPETPGEDGGYRRILMFVADGEPHSVTAEENLRRLQETEPSIRFDIQFVNVFDDFEKALEYGVLVTPCLILVEPLPRMTVVGTLQNLDSVRVALRLQAK